MVKTKEKIKIIIADDHPLFRRGLKNAFADTPDIEVVDEAENGDELLKKVSSGKYNIALVDVATSTKAILYLPLETFFNSSSPFSASSTTSMSGVSANAFFRPLLKSGWSSAIIILIFSFVFTISVLFNIDGYCSAFILSTSNLNKTAPYHSAFPHSKQT